MFCVSIALIVGGKPVIGVIYAPFLNQLFSACKGKGAFLNETQKLPLIQKPVPPIPENAPKGCVFSCEWGKDRRDIPDGNLHRKINSFLNMAAETGSRDGKGGMVHGVRSLGRFVHEHYMTIVNGCTLTSTTVQPWTLRTSQWGPLTYGGKVDVGNGKSFIPHQDSKRSQAKHKLTSISRDVAAGICLLQEAGGLVTTANPPEDSGSAPIEEVKLGSRLYLAIRPAGPSDKETGRQGQERLVREVWRRVCHLDYSRPGV